MTKRTILNIGLPRTGTTSTAAALETLGLKQKIPVARAIDAKRMKLNVVRAAKYPHPLICTLRPLDTWLPSALSYFPNATETAALELWHAHREWLATLTQPVGMFDVRDGYAGLFHALHRAVDGQWALPHLNQRSRLK